MFSFIDERKLKIKVLHKEISFVLSDIERVCLQKISKRTVWNLSVYNLHILAMHSCKFLERTDMSRRLHGTLVMRPFVRCINMVADFQAILCGKARIVEETLKMKK